MSTSETSDVKKIQEKIKHHIDELEEKIKNSKMYWNHCEYKFDNHFVQNFIDCHYNEIVNHVTQIKHHLEQINYHKKEVENVEARLAVVQQPPINLDQSVQESSTTDHQEDTTIKRSNEDKQRYRTLRASRYSSMKYVLQWEKMMDDQKEENPLDSIKRRSKPNSKPTTETSEEANVSKQMVKTRVMQFEKAQKPKRASSTIETFLDFSEDNQKRIMSYPIIEEMEEYNEHNRPKSCEFEARSEDNNIKVYLVNSDNSTMFQEDDFESCEDVSKEEPLKDNLEGINEENSIELKGSLEKMQEDRFQSCVDVRAKEDFANEDRCFEGELKEDHKINKDASEACEEERKRKGLSNEDLLERVNEDNLIGIQNCEDNRTNEELCKLKPSEDNTLLNGDIKEDSEKLREESGRFEDKSKNTNQAEAEEDPKHHKIGICEDRSEEEELLVDDHLKDATGDNHTGRKVTEEPLDDVRVLSENDHMKIIEANKVTPKVEDKEQDERGINNNDLEKEQNDDTQMENSKIISEKTIGGQGNKEERFNNEPISEETSTKPRIVLMHYKQDLPPDLLS